MTVIRIRPGPRSPAFPRQPQRAFADDVALDLVRTRPDRARLVIEPRPLPGTLAGVLGRAAPERLRRAEHRHCGVMQALAHLAPPELVDAADGAGFLALRGARNRPP